MKYKAGTLQYSDDLIEQYRYEHDKDFHVEKIRRGETLLAEKKKKSVIYAALTGLLAVAAVVHGADIANSQFLDASMGQDVFAIATAAASAIGTSYMALKNKSLANEINDEIYDSERMIESIEQTEEIRKK